MKLTNGSLEIEICDICDKSSYNIANCLKESDCIICGKAICDRCRASKFWADSWLPYEAKQYLKFGFCGECFERLEKLSREDFEEICGKKIEKAWSKDDYFQSWVSEEFKIVCADLSKKVGDTVIECIDKADKKYGNEIEEAKRKADIKKKIDELERKKEKLSKELIN